MKNRELRKKLAVVTAVTMVGVLGVAGCTNGNSGVTPGNVTSSEVTSSSEIGSETGDVTGDSGVDLNADSKPASDFTVAANEAWYGKLNFDDKSERENAERGLIDAPEELEILAEDGHVVWSQKAYAFLDESEEAPDSVNPSLWENVQNNHKYGLFEVTDGIYQVRGYDMANVTFIEGDTGWIIFDTSMTLETAEAAKALVDKNLGEKPVKAVLISHSHIDHFGGVRAFVDDDTIADSSLSLDKQVASGKIPVIVPEDFTEHSVSENLNARIRMMTVWDKDIMMETVLQHQKILSAIQEGSAEYAKIYIKAHLHRLENQLQQLIKDYPGYFVTDSVPVTERFAALLVQ